MNIDNAIQQLVIGTPWADRGQQRCGIIRDGKVVFEIKFPYCSAIEGLTESQLKEIALRTSLEIITVIKTH